MTRSPIYDLCKIKFPLPLVTFVKGPDISQEEEIIHITSKPGGTIDMAAKYLRYSGVPFKLDMKDFSHWLFEDYLALTSYLLQTFETTPQYY